MNGEPGQGRLALPVSPERDHILGSTAAVVTLLEYGDYECPYCAEAKDVVGGVQERMRDQFAFAFRYFPLTNVHPHAELAAEAAEAAGAQDAFWAMHAVLFDNQAHLELPDLLTYAEELGLDVDQFGEELAGRVHAPKVREDIVSGIQSGVTGTPTFFINGLRYAGSWDFVSLSSALERMARDSGRRRRVGI